MKDFQKTKEITPDIKTTKQDIRMGVLLTAILVAGLTAMGAIPSCNDIEVQINQIQGDK